jgi:transcriptional regulator with XRE-family HTH domain
VETFGEGLRRIRRSHNLSLRRLAKQLHFSYTYIGQVERGEKEGSSALAARCDRALQAGGALIELFAREEQRHRWHAQSLLLPALPAASAHTFERTAHSVDDDAERTAAHELPDLGLMWSPSLADTVATTTTMWRADVDRRVFLINSTFAAGGFTPAVRDWLTSWSDRDASHDGGRHVGPTDVTVLWDACQSFQEIDRRLGGQIARTSLVHFLDNVVAPLLAGTYDDATGRSLLAVAGRLTDIAAYSAYDAHEQGLAQRYYVQALRMARSAENQSLGAHILGDMTRQAYYIGDFDEAVALARAGQQSAARAGSNCGLARCASLEARALALRGDFIEADSAMVRAEKAMDRADAAGEEPWIRYFSYDQLQAEFAHAAEAMRRPTQVLEFATPALTAGRPLERRNLLVAATAARAYAATDNIDAAAAVGSRALDLVTTVSSQRGLEAVQTVRAVLSRYSAVPAARDFELKAHSVLDSVSA